MAEAKSKTVRKSQSKEEPSAVRSVAAPSRRKTGRVGAGKSAAGVAQSKGRTQARRKAATAAAVERPPAGAADAAAKTRRHGEIGKKTARKTEAAKTAASRVAKTSAAEGARGAAAKREVTGKALVVVESPAKARTIKKYLGRGYTVKASVGHVKDLPKSKLGVDVENDFEPEYVVIRDKSKVIKEIRDAAKQVDQVFLAPDPDREGEAIAWHIAEEIKDVNVNVKRVLINEITRKGITAALAAPTVLNTNKTEAQQARRILDRLVGYEISPLLWKKVRRGLSAGRVQSVAVRLLVEREQEIAKFIPVEYWSVDCDCRAEQPPPFQAKIWRWDGNKAAPKTEAEAAEIAAELAAGEARVATVERKERRRRPQPPFITSKLQQEAARKLRFAAKRTMRLAQLLYEGIELGDEGPVGLITYMRTDSTRISNDALDAVRTYIADQFGNDFLPGKANIYKTSQKAQDAHEAIRPTSMDYSPEVVERALASHRDGSDLIKLYRLIWCRFVASQMNPAVYDQTTVDIDRGRAVLRATGQVMKFPGFTSVYTEQETDDAAAEKAAQQDKLLPPLATGDLITLEKISPEQHFTQPPPRFTEASLVKELEEKGIGRPSTYATILSTIVDRGYVDKDGGRFKPTELGVLVNELLVASFPDIIDTEFTAQMEADLDKVEDGAQNWRQLLGRFYTPFRDDLEKAKTEMRDVKREEIPTEYFCEQCGAPMVVKWGRNGSFLACQGYPECRNTKEIIRKPDGGIEIAPEETTEETCHECGAAMKVKRGRFGAFLACSRYPDCKTTKAISLGIDCPRPGCSGFLTEKRSRRGKVFYGCANYAKTGCDFVSWDRPIAKPCPECDAPFVTRRESKRGATVRCLSCDFKSAESEESAA